MTEQEFFNLHHKIKFAGRNHPNTDARGYVVEYRLKVEKTLKRYLKPTEIVHHHYNKDGSATLVLCNGVFYHKLLHIRQEALQYCSHANWRKCKYCKQYDNPKNMNENSHGIYHKNCFKENYHAKKNIR